MFCTSFIYKTKFNNNYNKHELVKPVNKQLYCVRKWTKSTIVIKQMINKKSILKYTINY